MFGFLEKSMKPLSYLTLFEDLSIVYFSIGKFYFIIN